MCSRGSDSEPVPSIYSIHKYYACSRYRKGEKPTPYKKGYDQLAKIPKTQREIGFFFESADIGLSRRLFIGLSDSFFNEGVPRPAEVKYF